MTICIEERVELGVLEELEVRMEVRGAMKVGMVLNSKLILLLRYRNQGLGAKNNLEKQKTESTNEYVLQHPS